MMDDYNGRYLIYSSDRLVALQGLAQAFLKQVGTESNNYIYGHIQSEFPAQLL